MQQTVTRLRAWFEHQRFMRWLWMRCAACGESFSRGDMLYVVATDRGERKRVHEECFAAMRETWEQQQQTTGA